MSYLQENLRIIDLLYGVLRPLDTVQPCRLEMAMRNMFRDKKLKVADWWLAIKGYRASFSRYATSQQNDFVELSQRQVFGCCQCGTSATRDKLICQVRLFGRGRVISVHAKRSSRGMMVRYLAERGVENLQGIQSFDDEGYEFVEKASDETTFVFD